MARCLCVECFALSQIHPRLLFPHITTKLHQAAHKKIARHTKTASEPTSIATVGIEMTTLTYPSITAVAAKFRAAMVAGFVYRAGGNIRSCRKTSILLGQLGQCWSYYSLSQIRVAAAKMEKIETYWPQKYKNIKKHISVGQKKQSQWM